MASLKRRSLTPEQQPGSHKRAGGPQPIGDLSGAAVARLLEFVGLPAEVSTLDGTVTYANGAMERLTGSSLGELIGESALWVSDATVAAAGLASVRAGIDWTGTLDDPDLGVHSALLVPLRGAEGDVTACLTLIQAPVTPAVTGAREGTEFAPHRLDALGRMAGGIAHDFNNMLGVIANYAELALRRTEPGDAVREAVLRIHEAAQRSSRLTRQLLVLSRGEETETELLDVNALVFGLEELLRTTAGEGVTVATELTAAPATVRLARAQLEQVLLNLTANARDAMPAGGTVTIRSQNEAVDAALAATLGEVRPGGYVVIEVEDSGAGMTEEVAQRVFEPFFTTKERGSGRGLGLAIILGIVKAAGGHIALRSAPGAGTAFRVYLPNHSTIMATKPSPPFQRKARILIVDDEAPVRRAVAKLASGAGFDVMVARDAGEALLLLAQERVDLLLTDVVMPGMSGIALAEVAGERYPGMAVVYMSGYAHDVITERGLDPTQMLYLQKPFTRLELLRKVERALGPRTEARLADG